MPIPEILAALAALAAVYVIFAMVVAGMIMMFRGEEKFWPFLGYAIGYGLCPGLNALIFLAILWSLFEQKKASSK